MNLKVSRPLRIRTVKWLLEDIQLEAACVSAESLSLSGYLWERCKREEGKVKGLNFI